MNIEKPFRNRLHAGRQLARALPADLHGRDALVLALPRGGVPVGFVVAKELALELDILLVRKLGLPGHEEYAMGALGSGGVRVLQPEVVRSCGVTPAALEAICAREQREIERREQQYRGDYPAPTLQGRSVVLVDDGLATGASMRAAIEVARASAPARILVAVPVGAPDTCAALEPEVDALVCLLRPPAFRAVSTWYQHFDQTSDEEVQDLLALARRKRARPKEHVHARPIR
ncbi:MAG: phosphoribosyltransferase family protein [Pseudomonadota bacterium]